MKTLTPEQLVLLVVLLMVPLINFLLRPWLQRQTEAATSRANEPATRDAPRREPTPPVRAAQIRREAQRAHLPPARDDLPRFRRSEPFRVGSRPDLRRAILLMAVLGPCRGLEPREPAGHPSARGVARREGEAARDLR